MTSVRAESIRQLLCEQSPTLTGDVERTLAAVDPELARRVSSLLDYVEHGRTLLPAPSPATPELPDDSPLDVTIRCADETAGTEHHPAIVLSLTIGGRPSPGTSPKDPPQPGHLAHDFPNPLTARECEVLNLLAGGHTNKGIADYLFLSEHTVKSHLESLYRKLEVADRAHAVAEGFRRGLMDAGGADWVS